MYTKSLVVLSLALGLTACDANSSTPVVPAAVAKAEPLEWYELPSNLELDAEYEDLATNVINVDPGPHLMNASPTTRASIFYRQPIATPDAELTKAVTVLDKAGNTVPGTLMLSEDRILLTFCAAEAYKPYSRYTTRYQAVELEDGTVVKAFETSWETVADAQEANAPVGVAPCDDFLFTDDTDGPTWTVLSASVGDE